MWPRATVLPFLAFLLHLFVDVNSSEYDLSEAWEDETYLWQKQVVGSVGQPQRLQSGNAVIPLEIPDMFSEIGRGYCGSSENDEVANRIGTWVYGQSDNEARLRCSADSNCKGYHWSVGCNCFVLLAKVPKKTCCETELEDICYRREEPCAHPQARISFSMKIKGTDMNDARAGDAVITAIQQAVAAEAGPIIPASRVEVRLSAGNELQVTVLPPFEVKADMVKSTMTSGTLPQTLKDTIATAVAEDAVARSLEEPAADVQDTEDTMASEALPPLPEPVAEVEIIDLTSPEVQAVFCGDTAASHLDDSL